MDIDKLIEALQDAKGRGIKTATIILNNSEQRFCQIGIKEISVSELTGCVFYANGYDKDFIGYLKPGLK